MRLKSHNQAVNASATTDPLAHVLTFKLNKTRLNNRKLNINARLKPDTQKDVLRNIYLHGLHLQYLQFQLELKSLNRLNFLAYLKLSGKLFHRISAANL